MKPKEIFGIIVRVAGLFAIRLSLWLFYDYTKLHYEIGTYSTTFRPSDPRFMIWWAMGYLVLGVYLLAGAPYLLRWSYREPLSEEDVEKGDKGKP